MKTNKAVILAEPQTLATELQSIEHNLALFEERRDKIRQDLLASLKAQGVRRVDLESGDSYIIAHRDSLIVSNTMAAQKWALENPEARMKLDTSAALKVAKSGKLKWAKVEDKEHLRITRAKVEIE